MNWNLYLNAFIGILAILNPVAIIPLWAELTSDVGHKSRVRLAFMIVITGIASLILFIVGGRYILEFFSVDLMVFKVAGGILLLLTGIKMFEGTNTKIHNTEDEVDLDSPLSVAKQRFRKILVPMLIPVIVGPGSITTVIVYGSGAEQPLDYLFLSIDLILVLGIVFTTLVFSNILEKRVDPLVFTAIIRLFSIIVTAIAIQFMLEGLGDVFPKWVNGESPIEDNKTNVEQTE